MCVQGAAEGSLVLPGPLGPKFQRTAEGLKMAIPCPFASKQAMACFGELVVPHGRTGGLLFESPLAVAKVGFERVEVSGEV